MGPDPINRRRADLQALLAALILAAALSALIPAGGEEPAAPAQPDLSQASARYRPDGGQSLEAAASLQPNELAELNLGRQINLKQSRPEHLAHLPGLGLKSAATARERGCLTARQRRNLSGLIMEQCNPNKP